MKSIFFAVALFFNTASFCQQQITTLILLRHAEKGNDGSTDPDLSEVGKVRAESLVKLFNKTKIDAIYSTSYKRTKGTVALLAKAKSLTIEGYNPSKMEDIDAILQKYKGGTVVVVGHSNTTPAVANYLTGRKDEYPAFDDSEYGNMLIVSIVEKGRDVKVVWLSY
ncbi:hypothetical protein BH09BAC3_BH09BAC3_08200 [soil metagenome]